ncbi:cell wall / vacuolar inhibitor of fructosidase 2-like [Cocos nucifera]|uniref:Cell wall / vacuolar inhibitor of fructosidase 2-like n=1 Tax=Cocos nucifera TaxID=13894 RepID=A0A8K0IR59_COCNU|nr:cell wall / vacuolar inhibitor of fructosidase 2-like [Cocos nucifera]
MATILLFLRLSIAIRSTAASDANGNSTSRLDEVCKQTFDADLCIKALSIYPESQTFDFHGLAGLAVRAAASAAANISSYISGLLEEGSVEDDEDFQQCLYDCEENFVDAFDQLDELTVVIDNKEYEDVNLWVTVAETDRRMCDEGCKNASSEKKVKLVARSEEFSRLCGIVLNMTSFLATNHL